MNCAEKLLEPTIFFNSDSDTDSTVWQDYPLLDRCGIMNK